MKDLFNKESFLWADFDKQQRHQSLSISILLIVFFIFASFAFMNAFYCFVEIIGSIVSGSPDVAISDFLRSIPLFLSFFMTLWALFPLHAFFRNETEEKRNASLKKCSIAILIFAGVSILYVIIGLITGRYLSIIEGSPSPLFPLDSILYSAFFIALAIYFLIYRKEIQPKYPYLVPTRGPVVRRGRFGYCLVITLWMLCSLFSFSAFWMGLFIIDFIHGYLAYSIALLLVYFINWVYFAIWELYFNEMKEESRKKLLLPLAIIGLVIAVGTAVFYELALRLNLDGPSNVGFGVSPVAFAASVNIAQMLTVAAPVIVSVIALIKGIRLRRK